MGDMRQDLVSDMKIECPGKLALLSLQKEIMGLHKEAEVGRQALHECKAHQCPTNDDTEKKEEKDVCPDLHNMVNSLTAQVVSMAQQIKLVSLFCHIIVNQEQLFCHHMFNHHAKYTYTIMFGSLIWPGGLIGILHHV